MATREEIRQGMKLKAYRLFCQHCQALQKTMGWRGKPCWVTQYNEPEAVCASAIDAIDGLFAYLHSQGVVIEVGGKLPVEKSNMGNMSRAEVIDFFAYVTDDLGIVLALEFTPTSPSIYLEKSSKVLFCEKDLDGYKWRVKERVLHEIAHYFEVGKRRHGVGFYKLYVELISKYMAGYKRPIPLVEE